jgi:hypothetical protein
MPCEFFRGVVEQGGEEDKSGLYDSGHSGAAGGKTKPYSKPQTSQNDKKPKKANTNNRAGDGKGKAKGRIEALGGECTAGGDERRQGQNVRAAVEAEVAGAAEGKGVVEGEVVAEAAAEVGQEMLRQPPSRMAVAPCD